LLQEADLTEAGYESYVEALAKANDELDKNDEFTKRAADRNIELTNAISGLNVALKENIGNLLTARKTSVTYMKSIAKVSSAL
jgi:hypothetical protein